MESGCVGQRLEKPRRHSTGKITAKLTRLAPTHRGVSFVSLELAKTGLIDQCAQQGEAAFLANTHQCARLGRSQVSLSIIFTLISILTNNLPPKDGDVAVRRPEWALNWIQLRNWPTPSPACAPMNAPDR